jgi:hypothetical protein
MSWLRPSLLDGPQPIRLSEICWFDAGERIRECNVVQEAALVYRAMNLGDDVQA